MSRFSPARGETVDLTCGRRSTSHGLSPRAGNGDGSARDNTVRRRVIPACGERCSLRICLLPSTTSHPRARGTVPLLITDEAARHGPSPARGERCLCSSPTRRPATGHPRARGTVFSAAFKTLLSLRVIPARGERGYRLPAIADWGPVQPRARGTWTRLRPRTIVVVGSAPRAGNVVQLPVDDQVRRVVPESGERRNALVPSRCFQPPAHSPMRAPWRSGVRPVARGDCSRLLALAWCANLPPYSR